MRWFFVSLRLTDQRLAADTRSRDEKLRLRLRYPRLRCASWCLQSGIDQCEPNDSGTRRQVTVERGSDLLRRHPSDSRSHRSRSKTAGRCGRAGTGRCRCRSPGTGGKRRRRPPSPQP
jgi:hypothetical protein